VSIKPIVFRYRHSKSFKKAGQKAIRPRGPNRGRGGRGRASSFANRA